MTTKSNFETLERIVLRQQRELAVLHAIENHAGLSIELYDLQGILIRHNPSAICHLMPCSEELVDKRINEIYPDNGNDFLDRINHIAQTRKPRDYEDKIPLQNGHIWLASTYSPVNDKKGNLFAIQIISKDISTFKNAENKLKESESRYRASFEAAAVGMCIADKEGNFVTINSAVCSLFGFTEQEMLASNFRDVTLPSDVERSISQFRECITERKSILFENRYQTKKANTIYGLTSISPIFDKKGEFLYAIALLQDITQLKLTEDALRSSEAALTEAQEIGQIGSFAWEKQTDSLKWSKQMFRISGLTPEEFDGNLQNTITRIVHPEDLQSVVEQITDMVEQKRPWFMEFRIIRPDGEIRWIRSGTRFIFDDQGMTKASIGVNQDITEQKQAEEQIRTSLKEKETLLQEIHHRVKNNMQVISSLLKLQARAIDDEKLKVSFEESQNRINAMSVVHEILHNSHNLSSIDIKRYLNNVVSSLAQSYQMNPSNIQITIESDDVELSIEQANPIGLILNELVSNSYKYAFPGNNEGRIHVSLERTDDTMLELVIEDNGVGLPADLDWRKAETLGLQLVITLVENQLDGLIECETKDGCKFIIIFEMINR